MTDFQILAIPGSLRIGSFNRRLLEELARLAPIGFSVSIFDRVEEIPLFNEDLEAAPCASVLRLWSQVAASDGLVIATPEYNQGIAAVTKNLVDWLSRDPKHALQSKPVAVTGATVGKTGTRLAQQQLRSVLSICGALLVPEFMYIAKASHDEFDNAILSSFMEAVAKWIHKLSERDHPISEQMK